MRYEALRHISPLGPWQTGPSGAPLARFLVEFPLERMSCMLTMTKTFFLPVYNAPEELQGKVFQRMQGSELKYIGRVCMLF
jgi:hypothetical protein